MRISLNFWLNYIIQMHIAHFIKFLTELHNSFFTIRNLIGKMKGTTITQKKKKLDEVLQPFKKDFHKIYFNELRMSWEEGHLCSFENKLWNYSFEVPHYVVLILMSVFFETSRSTSPFSYLIISGNLSF